METLMALSFPSTDPTTAEVVAAVMATLVNISCYTDTDAEALRLLADAALLVLSATCDHLPQLSPRDAQSAVLALRMAEHVSLAQSVAVRSLPAVQGLKDRIAGIAAAKLPSSGWSVLSEVVTTAVAVKRKLQAEPSPPSRPRS
jgi:hypothetical protein